MFVDFFQIYVVHISGKCIYESKKEQRDIYLCPSRQNLCPVSYHHPTGIRKISPTVAFFWL